MRYVGLYVPNGCSTGKTSVTGTAQLLYRRFRWIRYARGFDTQRFSAFYFILRH